MLKVLAFTCSKDRPFMLRAVIIQMLIQTFPVDFSVYANSQDHKQKEKDFRELISDMEAEFEARGRRFYFSAGPTRHQHYNHLEAINQVNIDDYDLFLKIDDDDIYKTDYVNNVVGYFTKFKRDLSGQGSYGVVCSDIYIADQELDNFGVGKGRKNCGLSATWAFSRKALDEIIHFDMSGKLSSFEDKLWKQHLEDNTDAVIGFRKCRKGLYICNIHGENTTTGPNSPFLKRNLQA